MGLDLLPFSGRANRKEKGKGVAPSPTPRGRWRNPDRGTSALAQTRRDQPRLSPEEAVTAARERVQKLERALEVLGEDSGPEFQVLQNSVKKAKAAAQGVPVGVQLEQTLKFVERSEKRLRVLDKERAKEARLLEEAQQRVARLRSELAAESPHHSPRLRTRIGSVESLCGGITTRAGRSSCSVVDGEERGAVVGGAGHCPIHHP